MPIIFSTTTPASPACQPPARSYFEAPDDALLARVTEKVAERMGRHLSYAFHDEAPGGVTPIILEDVGPPAQPQAIPDALTERGAKAWTGVDAQGLRDGFTAADMTTAGSGNGE